MPTVGKVTSRTGDVDVHVTGHQNDDEGAPPAAFARLGLLALAEPDSCDYEGRNITIRGQKIGGPDRFIETCLYDNQPTLGGLTVIAGGSAFINELSGDLRLKSATVSPGDPTLPNDLTLTTTNGSILDFENDAANDVMANRVVLIAGGNGSIGTVAKALDIDTSRAGWRSGWVYALADAELNLVETVGELLVLGALSLTGSVRLATVDSAAPDPGIDARGVAYQAETIELILSGEFVAAQGSLCSPPRRTTSTAPRCRASGRCSAAFRWRRAMTSGLPRAASSLPATT